VKLVFPFRFFFCAEVSLRLYFAALADWTAVRTCCAKGCIDGVRWLCCCIRGRRREVVDSREVAMSVGYACNEC